MISAGVSSSKTTTASTHASAARTSARSCSGLIGRAGPLLRRTEASALRPTISDVAERARRLQVADVPGMQQVEHAVGEDDASARRARSAATSATAASRVSTPRDAAAVDLHGVLAGARERQPVGEAPLVARPVDADVLGARLHAERVEQAVVVVGVAVAACGRRRRACRCLRPDRGCRS